MRRFPVHVLREQMKVRVRTLPGDKTEKVLDLANGSTVEGAIRKLGLYPDAWIAVKGDTPVSLDDTLKDGDEVKLVAVVSGG